MWQIGPAVALLSAAMVAHVAAYTVDCNHEYTDCDIEIVKTQPEDEVPNQELSLTTQPHYILPETTETTQITETQTQTEKQKEPSNVAAKPEARLINLNVEDLQRFANSLHNQSLGDERTNKKLLADLSDVNLDEEEEKESPKVVVRPPVEEPTPDKFYKNLEAPFNPLLTMEIPEEMDMCRENGITYKAGERIDRGCEETCECTINGVFDCAPRCTHPYIRRGRRLNDPLCFETPIDECCSIEACTTHGDPKVTGPVCRYGNETYTVGSGWNVECEKVCVCENNSVVNCKPRCNPILQSDKCINVQDPNDSCCEIQVCDVSVQDAHEDSMENSTSSVFNSTTSTPAPITAEDVTESEEFMEATKTPQRSVALTEPIGSVVVLQNNSVQVNLMRFNDSKDPVHLLLSDDGGNSFSDVVLEHSNLILNLRGGRDYILKTKETGTKFNFTITASGYPNNSQTNKNVANSTLTGCHQDGKFYAIGEEFLIGCSEICECTGIETRDCAALECPSHVGLELVSKGCVRWAPSPPAEPPNCCPRAARCLSDGTCHYKGIAIPNWTEVPVTLTGCEERCFCENGELDCQQICNPLPDLPPQTLRCPQMHRPAPVNVSDDDCCKQWGCVPNHHVTMVPDSETSTSPPRVDKPFLPTILPDLHFPQELPDYEQNNIHRPVHSLDLPPTEPTNVNEKLSVISIDADSPTSIKMLFGLPPVLVGLSGSVDLRYTEKADEDISHWHSQVFAPADEILTTSRLEFRLTGLKPVTTYRIRAKLYLHNLSVAPESEVFSMMTPQQEKRREIHSSLIVANVNDTSAHVSWRRFTEDELQYIDGIQVRYRQLGALTYSVTELLHHSRSSVELHRLHPNTKYEVSLELVPPPRSLIELYDPLGVEFTTLSYSIAREEGKRRQIDSDLIVMDVNDTTAHISWRHFTEDELQFIDGIQVRYRPVGTPIYLMTELLHHSRLTAELHDLRPSSKYEASLVLIPPPHSLTELYDPQGVEFTTSPYMDPYNWSVTIDVRAVGSEAAEMSWRGVPSPAERWVRVYRAAHACINDMRRENDEFRLAARDLSPMVTLTGLKPDTKCRVWLELFLTNGKVKTSNVVEINTKSLDSPEPIDNEIAQSSTADGRGSPRSDYYGALVVVGVVAAFGAVTSLLLLLVVVRRHRPRSVPITPMPSAPRESSLPPYDNPAYKLELQQETMDL